MKQKILDKPLSVEDMKKQMETHGCVIGTVKVALHEVIAHDLNGFIDLLSERLTGGHFLTDTNWHVTGHKGDTLHICVSGDACQTIAKHKLTAYGQSGKE